MTTKTRKFKAKGMHCSSCETLIERSLKKLKGIKSVKVDYPTETVEVTYNSKKLTLTKIMNVVNKKGYITSLKTKASNKKWLGITLGIIGLLILIFFVIKVADGITMPEISQNMGYGLIFIVGLLTGFHCISMCGGFVVSYATKQAQQGKKAYKAHLMYGVGKTVSYTVIGAAFGLLGSVIAFTPTMRGVIGILAGLFLIIFGLNMLNIFTSLRKIRVKSSFLDKFVVKRRKHNSPLIIGLLNGLMIACGPLLAIYIMAAGTGSAIEGAKILFIFALGTLPVMLSFGFLTSILSNRVTHKILKASGVIVIILGLVMLNRGLALTGSGLDATSLLTSLSEETSEDGIVMQNGYQIIKMDVTRQGWEPNKFILKKDVPVKWIITGKEITGCNNAINVAKLNLEFDIKEGEQIIEFTPTEEGIISWSCWMGMIPGTFIVKENIDNTEIQKELAAVQQQPKSCDGSCGSSTCGAAQGRSCGCGSR